MARPGPRPMPANVIALTGREVDPRRREVKVPPVAPDPPAWLSPGGRAAWKELSPELERVGLLTRIDVYSFALACEDLAIARTALEAMRRDKRSGYRVLEVDEAHAGRLRRHPAFIVYQQAEASFLRWVKEFGMTPSARVGLPSPEDEGDDDSDLLD